MQLLTNDEKNQLINDFNKSKSFIIYTIGLKPEINNTIVEDSDRFILNNKDSVINLFKSKQFIGIKLEDLNEELFNLEYNDKNILIDAVALRKKTYTLVERSKIYSEKIKLLYDCKKKNNLHIVFIAYIDHH